MSFVFAAGVAAAAVPAPAAMLDRIVATVDERAITLSELNRAVLTGVIAPEAGETHGTFRERVLNVMIDEYLRYRDALRFSPTSPDPAEVDRSLETLRARLRAEGKDPDAEFRAAGLSAPEVRASLERQIVVRQYVRDRFAALAFVSSEDLDQEYAAVVEEARTAGRPAPARPTIEDQLRERIRDRRTVEEIDKWTKDLREKARITILSEAPSLPEGKPVVLSKAP